MSQQAAQSTAQTEQVEGSSEQQTDGPDVRHLMTKSVAALEARRERCRIAAKAARARKKGEFEQMRSEIAQLEKANAALSKEVQKLKAQIARYRSERMSNAAVNSTPGVRHQEPASMLLPSSAGNMAAHIMAAVPGTACVASGAGTVMGTSAAPPVQDGTPECLLLEGAADARGGSGTPGESHTAAAGPSAPTRGVSEQPTSLTGAKAQLHDALLNFMQKSPSGEASARGNMPQGTLAGAPTPVTTRGAFSAVPTIWEDGSAVPRLPVMVEQQLQAAAIPAAQARGQAMQCDPDDEHTPENNSGSTWRTASISQLLASPPATGGATVDCYAAQAGAIAVGIPLDVPPSGADYAAHPLAPDQQGACCPPLLAGFHQPFHQPFQQPSSFAQLHYPNMHAPQPWQAPSMPAGAVLPFHGQQAVGLAPSAGAAVASLAIGGTVDWQTRSNMQPTLPSAGYREVMEYSAFC